MTIFTKNLYPDTHSGSVISDISHFPSCYLLPFVGIPKASRAEPETVEGGPKNSSHTQLSVPNTRQHVFNISSLNMHEIRGSRLHCFLLSDKHCFWNLSSACTHALNVLLEQENDLTEWHVSWTKADMAEYNIHIVLIILPCQLFDNFFYSFIITVQGCVI